MSRKRKQPRRVETVDPAYQPNKNELTEDLRVEASFNEAVDALLSL